MNATADAWIVGLEMVLCLRMSWADFVGAPHQPQTMRPYDFGAQKCSLKDVISRLNIVGRISLKGGIHGLHNMRPYFPCVSLTGA